MADKKNQAKTSSNDADDHLLPSEVVKLSALTPHPRNYNEHPDEQLEHIIASITQHGIYRNVVVARDYTILAGHGVCLAAAKMGLEEIPVVRVDLSPDDPRALKILSGDNEIGRLAQVNDRLLTDTLKEIRGGLGLLGTGFNEDQFANLLLTTRTETEVPNKTEAMKLMGVDGYEDKDAARYPLVITFRNTADRLAFCEKIKRAAEHDSAKRRLKLFWESRSTTTEASQ